MKGWEAAATEAAWPHHQDQHPSDAEQIAHLFSYLLKEQARGRLDAVAS